MIPLLPDLPLAVGLRPFVKPQPKLVGSKESIRAGNEYEHC